MDRNMAKKVGDETFDDKMKSIGTLYVVILGVSIVMLPLVGVSLGLAVHLFLRLSGLG